MPFFFLASAAVDVKKHRIMFHRVMDYVWVRFFYPLLFFFSVCAFFTSYLKWEKEFLRFWSLLGVFLPSGISMWGTPGDMKQRPSVKEKKRNETDLIAAGLCILFFKAHFTVVLWKFRLQIIANKPSHLRTKKT